MPDSFGARLRHRREERQIDLIAIAEQSKIKLSLLEALERDDVSHWPSGIYRRAYVKTYALAVGLDPDVVLREFLEAHPEPAEVIAAAAAAAALEEASRNSAAPPTRLRTIMDQAMGSLAKLRRPGAIDEPAAAGAPNTPAATHAYQPPNPPHLAAPSRPAVPGDAIPSARREPAPPPSSVAGGSAVWSDRLLPDPVNETAGAGQAVGEEAGPGSNVPAAAALPQHRTEAQNTAEVQREVAVAEARTSLDSRLEAVARLCTEFGRVVERADVQELLGDAARVLEATGVIVWLWDETAEALRPALVHGYPEKVLAQLPMVKRDDDNATAEAFRTTQACEVAAAIEMSGALVVPLLIPGGCAGVLAVELQQGVELSRSIRALATVLGAAVTQLVFRSHPASQRPQNEQANPPAAKYRPPLQPARVRR